VAVRVRRADLPSENSWSISLLSERQREAKDGEVCIGRAARLIRTVRNPQAFTKYAHKFSPPVIQLSEICESWGRELRAEARQ
jgi:hypothetical protein